MSLALVHDRHVAVVPKTEWPLYRVPVTDLLDRGSEIEAEGMAFCCAAAHAACRAYLAGEYSRFDAHTTTNCCHGLSLLVRDVLLTCSHIDVRELLEAPKIWTLPLPLLLLTKLYLLCLATEHDGTIRRSATTKLSALYPVGRKFCDRLVKRLQTELSNLVARRYQELGESLEPDMLSAGVPLAQWARYVGAECFREDRRGRLYAPCVYSMQVCLAYLAASGAKIAVRCERGGEIVQTLLVHDGSRWVPTGGLSGEPVVVFSGFATGEGLEGWLERFDHLVLANDLHYPQFPAVRDDPEFDSSPIEPEEQELREAFERHRVVKGVSLEDPSLFCLTHIHPASVGELGGSQLPSYSVQA